MKQILGRIAAVLGLMALAIGGYDAYAAAGDKISGRVSCEGKGIGNVVVTDGTNFTLTDKNGKFSIVPDKDARFVYISTPAGYLTECKDRTIPQFYQRLDRENPKAAYNFELKRNEIGDEKHVFYVQADPQVTSMEEVAKYGSFLNDLNDYSEPLRGNTDIFSFDAGDIVGDSPFLFPAYIDTVAKVDMPIYRAIGNHDMTYGGRTFEYSFRTFEDYFGPVCYSFNKGKAHYIIMDNCFYINRDYQYIGYIDEKTFRWIEQDLSYVPKDHLVFVVAHIQISSTKKLAWNTLFQDETSNAKGLFEMLDGWDAHILTGHSHFNHNVCFHEKLMEHNTASACGIWWKSDLCMDGTPSGYGVYEVDGNKVKWLYKGAGHSDEYQFRGYGIGENSEYPEEISANVWNWDDEWKVEWTEDGKVMGEMEHYTGYDPLSAAICADKTIVEYDWISPIHTWHMFKAKPENPNAVLGVRVTDRFGNVYEQNVASAKKKPALMWFDAEANFARFSSKDSIDYYLNKIRNLGFTHAVVDVRPITGEVLYDSEIAPKMTEWRGFRRGDFDYLGYFIEKGHELGLEIHASLNVFCAGHNYHDRGLIYDGHPEWASVVYNPRKGLIPITEEKHKYGAMVNPLNEEYRTHIIGVLKELVGKYPELDGLMLDRVRYDGISADFSEISRSRFEEYIGAKVENWPEDILTWKRANSRRPVPQPGKLAPKWFEWRTKVITEFMAQMRAEVKSLRPEISFGTYTGAWYPSYYEVGVNFASKEYDPAEDFDWATPEYKNYGYAELLDLYVTGNYYTDITIDEYRKNKHSVWNETDSQAQEGTWYCVEGSCQNMRKILKGNKFVGGILVDQFYSHPDKLSETIAENLKDSDGLMVFDIVHIISKNLWKEVEDGMRKGGML